jgi:hypothetical protein
MAADALLACMRVWCGGTPLAGCHQLSPGTGSSFEQCTMQSRQYAAMKQWSSTMMGWHPFYFTAWTPLQCMIVLCCRCVAGAGSHPMAHQSPGASSLSCTCASSAATASRAAKGSASEGIYTQCGGFRPRVHGQGNCHGTCRLLQRSMAHHTRAAMEDEDAWCQVEGYTVGGITCNHYICSRALCTLWRLHVFIPGYRRVFITHNFQAWACIPRYRKGSLSR